MAMCYMIMISSKKLSDCSATRPWTILKHMIKSAWSLRSSKRSIPSRVQRSLYPYEQHPGKQTFCKSSLDGFDVVYQIWRDGRPYCYVTMQIIFEFSVNKYQSNKYFSTTYLRDWVLHHSSLHSLSIAVFEHGDFKGSVATELRCGRMFNSGFIINLLMSLTVKEFWKSVSIRQSSR